MSIVVAPSAIGVLVIVITGGVRVREELSSARSGAVPNQPSLLSLTALSFLLRV
ncbi:Os02g0214050 [Oryza sativa Japonica Group]|jgi:hypothetical protein|uniref:Os02g0214050 protein n=2 Tax=Oryza sativa subsp. japonica TaxID=39947 RepID=Q6H8B4_ORYSJ|nr:hypothetical protein EE612_009738 [Oryza sativa]BAD25035.1 hypothetical protein [Oryza sativa Japonica Group]BAS77618.1 Os02g0214050 [Oryza sativa Japonica Group]